MRVACIGGGPAGLYFAISMKLRDPAHEVVVFERNRPDDTFGWGVVLSDEALGNLARNDPVIGRRDPRDISPTGTTSTSSSQGERIVSGGHGFCGIGRKKLLLLLQDRARELGVELRFQDDVAPDEIEALAADYDLVVASDGLNSRTRTRYADHFGPTSTRRKCKFVWLGTKQKFDDAFTFIFEETDARLALGPRLPVRRRHRDLHRRMHRGDLERLGFGDDEPAGVDRHLRGDLRRRARRPSPSSPTPTTSAARPGSASRASSARSWCYGTSC